MTAWHREEPRDVRPFFQARKAEDALEGTGIRLFKGGDVLLDPIFDLDEVDFQKLAPVVHLSLVSPALWMPEGLTKADLELLLIARHSFLKRSITVDRQPLTSGLQEEWPLAAEVLAELGGGRNMQLTLALCLANDREPTPGAPFVVGHWLARKTFMLRWRATPTLFDLRTRTDAEWVAANYPAKTFLAVEYIAGIEAEAEDGSSIATAFIHVDAHNKMVNSPSGEMLQPLVAAEVITTILEMSYPDWEKLELALPGSPLATVLKQLGTDRPMTLPELKSLVSSPPKLQAMLQDRLGVVQAIR